MIYSTSFVEQENRDSLTPSGFTLQETELTFEAGVRVSPEVLEFSAGVGVILRTGADAGSRRFIYDAVDTDVVEALIIVRVGPEALSNSFRSFLEFCYADVDNLYRFAATSGTAFSLFRRVAGVATTLGTVSFSTTGSTDYCMLVQKIGTALKAKVWAQGAAEPGWQIEVTDASLSSGRVAFGSLVGATAHRFQEFRIATEGDEVPRGFGSPRRPISLGVSGGVATFKQFELDAIGSSRGTAQAADNRTVTGWQIRHRIGVGAWVIEASLTIASVSPSSLYEVQIRIIDSLDEVGEWSGSYWLTTPPADRALVAEDFTSYATTAELLDIWVPRWFTEYLNTVVFASLPMRAFGSDLLTNFLAGYEFTRVDRGNNYRIRVLMQGGTTDIGLVFTATDEIIPGGVVVNYHPVTQILQIVTARANGLGYDELEEIGSIIRATEFFYVEADYDPDLARVRARVYEEWRTPPEWQLVATGIAPAVSASLPMVVLFESFQYRNLLSVEWEYDVIVPDAESLGLITTSGESLACPSELEGWNAHTNLPGSAPNNLITVGYDSINRVLVAAGDGGIVRSINGGLAWSGPFNPGWGDYASETPIIAAGGIAFNGGVWLALDRFGGWSLSLDGGLTWSAMQWPSDGGEESALDTVGIRLAIGPAGVWAYATGSTVRRFLSGAWSISSALLDIAAPSALLRVAEGVWVVGGSGIQRCLSDTLAPAGWEEMARLVVSSAFESDIFLGEGPEVLPLNITSLVCTTRQGGERLWAFGDSDFLVYSDDRGITWSNSFCNHALADAGASMHPLLNWRREQRVSPAGGFGTSQIYGIAQHRSEPSMLIATGRWDTIVGEATVSRVAYSCSQDFGSTWQPVHLIPGLPTERADERARGPIYIY